jgi:hypothetical protein
MTQRANAPLFPACRLWERTSERGNRYLVGRWGGVKVLVMPNRDRAGDDDATHVLLITEAAQPMAQAAAAARPGAHPAPAQRQQRGPSRRRDVAKARLAGRAAEPIADDPLPF